jgi:uncharacterized protein YqjF (DUF2071 family)
MNAASVNQIMRHMLFINYAVPQARLRPLVPTELELDTIGSIAFVSVVCFINAKLKIALLPMLLPSYNQMNCRTYVNASEGPAVYFLSMAISSRVIRAGAIALGLPMRRADIKIEAVQTSDRAQLMRYAAKSNRVQQLEAEVVVNNFCESAWPMTDVVPPEFITERSVGYVATTSGSILKIVVEHEPLSAQRVLVERIKAPLLTSLGVFNSDESAHLASVFYVQAASFTTKLTLPWRSRLKEIGRR